MAEMQARLADQQKIVEELTEENQAAKSTKTLSAVSCIFHSHRDYGIGCVLNECLSLAIARPP